MYNLYRLIPGLTKDIPISLVSKEDAELYIRQNLSIGIFIATAFIKIDNNKQAACYCNKYKNELIISLDNPKDYELSYNLDELTITKIKTVEDLIKETRIDTAVDLKSIEHFATLLKTELQEGIDRAVTKYLEAIKHE